MKIGDVLKEKQPEMYYKLNENKHKKEKERKTRKEHLSFYDIKRIMEDAPVYKRGKGGAVKQIR